MGPHGTSTSSRPGRKWATQEEMSSEQVSETSSANPHCSSSIALPPGPSPAHPWKIYLPQNQSLLLKRLGTTTLTPQGKHTHIYTYICTENTNAYIYAQIHLCRQACIIHIFVHTHTHTWLKWLRICLQYRRQIRVLGQEAPLEEEMATHSSMLAWKIPWTEESGRLQSMGLQRITHGWTCMHLYMHAHTCTHTCVQLYTHIYT